MVFCVDYSLHVYTYIRVYTKQRNKEKDNSAYKCGTYNAARDTVATASIW